MQGRDTAVRSGTEVRWKKSPICFTASRSSCSRSTSCVMVVGIVLGVIIGVLPGLGGANGVAILLPLTFSMSPTSAIIMLSCIYWGALFGGAITSILFNIPGEPWSVATTFDGHPMAQQGKAGEALTAAFTSSFVGALFAVIVITLVAPLVARFALQFGPAEKFSRLFPGLLQLRRHEQGAADQDHRLDDDRLCARRRRPRPHDRAAAPDLRLHRTAHRLRLPDRGDRPVRHRRDPADDGGGPRVQGQAGPRSIRRVVLQTWKELPRYWATSLRSCIIGCWMGITPAGATPASFMSYGIAKRMSPARQELRQGRDRRRGGAGNRGACRRHRRRCCRCSRSACRARRPPPCCSAAC